MPTLTPETLDFIVRHKDDDVLRLAFLSDKNPRVDMSTALQQIQGRQIARRKLPSWYKEESILYPPHISLEQCSGEHAARYKAALTRRLGSKTLVDLTGGLGVDFSFMARETEKAMYVERQENLCELARNNFPLLHLPQAEIIQRKAEEVLPTLPKVDLIYIDPSRRGPSGAKTYAINDCVPNVQALKEELLRHAKTVIIKLSPMLDWHAAVESMRCGDGGVTEVHVVSTANECKELLLLLTPKAPTQPKIYCVNDDTVFSYDANEIFPPLSFVEPHANEILLLLNASVMKVGGFTAVASRYHLKAIAPNSHLLLSHTAANSIPTPPTIPNTEDKGLPFRPFHIKTVSSLNKKSLRQATQGIRQANVAVRNFPLSAEALRNKLKLGDGGDTYIFGTTTASSAHILLFCERIEQLPARDQ